MIPMLRRRLQSFAFAWRGMRVLVTTQGNARIHLAVTVLVIATGIALDVSRGEWLWLVGAISAVWTAEAFNTAMEFLADEISLEQRDRIGRAKDLSAAAVLSTAIGAAVIGAMVFAPRLAALLR